MQSNDIKDKKTLADARKSIETVRIDYINEWMSHPFNYCCLYCCWIMDTIK